MRGSTRGSSRSERHGAAYYGKLAVAYLATVSIGVGVMKAAGVREIVGTLPPEIEMALNVASLLLVVLIIMVTLRVMKL